MRRRALLCAVALIAAMTAVGAARPGVAGDAALQSLIDGAQRSEKNRVRDR